ncbi:zinc finger protein zat1-related [Anaeramoeba flamelloides]|uniref:Zinc finger protein zat1-related n=1 Tax=Anaeramoeba flamelloides TaxID=1746091 RepID=A0ABQ8XH71_9EUKA|nr:zinc finger protein zat1-related [Anaeramoeba flamelloides]
MLQINHRCKYCCENFSRLSQLEKHILRKHNIVLPRSNNEETTPKKTIDKKNQKIEEMEKQQQERCVDHEFIDINIEYEVLDELFENQKDEEEPPKTMRTINKHLTENINIKKAKDIDFTLETLVGKKSQLVLETERIKTKYYSPITWLNLFVNTKLLNTCVQREDLNIGIPVHQEGYKPTKISSTTAFQEKIKSFPDVGADFQIMIGFYYDDFESTSTFSLGGLYMFIDNLDFSWRLKDQTIFLISLFPGKTNINNILRRLPLLEDLEKLKMGISLGGKKIQALVSCFVGDTRESLPARGRLQPGGLFACPMCKFKLGSDEFTDSTAKKEPRTKIETTKIQKDMIKDFSNVDNNIYRYRKIHQKEKNRSKITI